MATTGALEGEILAEDISTSEPELLEAQPFASGWRLRLMRFGLLAGLLAIWEAAAGNPRTEFALIDKFWVSQPSDILGRLGDWIGRGTLGFHLAITLPEMSVGFVIGSVVGIASGFILGRNLALARLFDPFIVAIYSIPKLALAPLFILWFG